MLNFIQRPVNKLFTNKSQNDLKVKKKTIYGINAKEEFNPEDLFTVEEIDILKNSFYDENRYKNFLNKITILQKATVFSIVILSFFTSTNKGIVVPSFDLASMIPSILNIEFFICSLLFNIS